MAGPDPDARRRPRQPGRAAALAWLACAAVVWNVVFDDGVTQGVRDYLTRQALHQQGRGPAVTIPEVMDPATARAARAATAWGGGIGALGLLVVWAASRRRPGPSPARPE